MSCTGPVVAVNRLHTYASPAGGATNKVTIELPGTLASAWNAPPTVSVWLFAYVGVATASGCPNCTSQESLQSVRH